MPATETNLARAPATVIFDGNTTHVERSLTAGDDLWLTLPDLEACTRWELKPEGVCRDDVCIPIPPDKASAFLRQEGGETWFNLTEFARFLEQPYARNAEHHVWLFGTSYLERQSRTDPRIAPDFTLPDLDGRLHTLSDYRGKKVFLLCWASW